MAMEIVAIMVLDLKEDPQETQMAEMIVTIIHITLVEAMDRVDALTIIIITIGTEVTLYWQLYTRSIIPQVQWKRSNTIAIICMSDCFN